MTHRGVRAAPRAVVEVIEVGVFGFPGEGAGAEHGRGDEEAVAEGRQDLKRIDRGLHVRAIRFAHFWTAHRRVGASDVMWLIGH